MLLKLKKLRFLTKSDFVNNSFWGLLSTLSQTVFLSLFFIIVSRYYSIVDFSNFLIANTIYQLIVGFSSMGLGHWFIREYGLGKEDLVSLSYRFIKIQSILGLLFYMINIVVAYIIYTNENIRILAIILGTNIIFDNLIYALRSLNVAQLQQKKTAIILAIDGLLRLVIGLMLFLYSFSIVHLSILMIVIRLATLGLFIRIGTDGSLSFKTLWKFKITLADLKTNVLLNWNFILIVGLSVVFWRSATIVISKYLTAVDVANYEIAYKIFSIFMQISVVVSVTLYPKFIKFLNTGNYDSVRKFYKVICFGYSVFVIMIYGFIQSYAQTIIPYLFGHKFLFAAACMKEMFLTMLVFPFIFLQANLLVALKKEKMDMLLNVLALTVNLLGYFIGLQYSRSLSVINYSIFGSFLVFHIAQNLLLIKMKISEFKTALMFYLSIAGFVMLYTYLLNVYNGNIVFIGFCIVVFIPLIFIFINKIKTVFVGQKFNVSTQYVPR